MAYVSCGITCHVDIYEGVQVTKNPIVEAKNGIKCKKLLNASLFWNPQSTANWEDGWTERQSTQHNTQCTVCYIEMNKRKMSCTNARKWLILKLRRIACTLVRKRQNMTVSSFIISSEFDCHYCAIKLITGIRKHRNRPCQVEQTQSPAKQLFHLRCSRLPGK